MPAGSETELPLAKAELIGDGGSHFFVCGESGAPSPPGQRAVTAASISPVPRRVDVSPSSFFTTGTSTSILADTGEGPSTSHLAQPSPLAPRSFCWENRPEQAVEAAPGESTTCLICLEPVGDSTSYSVMVRPVCKHAWFHRHCIHNQAIHVGYSCFCCPHCQNTNQFLMEMLSMGIRIPRRLVFIHPAHKAGGCELCPATACPKSPGPPLSHESRIQLHRAVANQAGTPCICLMPGQQGVINFPFSIRLLSCENSGANAAFNERHRRCDASECLCPGGRELAEEEG
ncbi:uncharacterized protein LOC121086607 [Falco naumanni]|uniref:uncharacterized protein LOC121086607 n=1 Tax=Falco naumanni TaxID=148594 RepID=UPI001ADEA3DF|nr:uncharacterized protein LOC121086607 [Falco naumanni]